jgi:hypothetical protein
MAIKWRDVDWSGHGLIRSTETSIENQIQTHRSLTATFPHTVHYITCCMFRVVLEMASLKLSDTLHIWWTDCWMLFEVQVCECCMASLMAATWLALSQAFIIHKGHCIMFSYCVCVMDVRHDVTYISAVCEHAVQFDTEDSHCEAILEV